MNDKRTFGNYVGQWGLVQEKGLPNSGVITVNHNAVAAYDLVKHQEMPLTLKNGTSSFNAKLDAGDGMLVLMLDRKIDKIVLNMPEKLQCGRDFAIKIKILDTCNTPIQAILPLEVTVTTDSGMQIPPSGFYAAVNGELIIKDVVPTNLKTGKINITVRCLASGKTIQKNVQIIR